MQPQMKKEGIDPKVIKWIKIGVISTAALIITLMAGLPLYKVYSQTLAGKAELMKQEQTRQIIVEQARAEKAAAELRAEAIKTLGEAAQKYPEYRLQEFMGAFAEALQNGDIDKLIFVPTEANIPLMKSATDSD